MMTEQDHAKEIAQYKDLLTIQEKAYKFLKQQYDDRCATLDRIYEFCEGIGAAHIVNGEDLKPAELKKAERYVADSIFSIIGGKPDVAEAVGEAKSQGGA